MGCAQRSALNRSRLRQRAAPEGASARRTVGLPVVSAGMPSQRVRCGAGVAGWRSPAAAVVLLLRTVSGAFTCTRSGTTCSALGDLYAATNGAGWELPNPSGVGVPLQAWAAAASGVATDYCAFEGAACDSANNLVSLCAPGRAAEPAPPHAPWGACADVRELGCHAPCAPTPSADALPARRAGRSAAAHWWALCRRRWARS